MRRQRPFDTSTSGLSTLLAACASAAIVGCNSSDEPSGPDLTAPAASSFVQNRDVDPTGQTVTVTFSEEVTAATAEIDANYTVSGKMSVQSAVLRADGRNVDLALNGLAIPGEVTIDIAAGIEDAAGNASEAVTAQAIVSTDTTAPAAASIVGTTIEGPENDTIAVTFSDNMIESEVETLSNWTVQAPLGTNFDVTGATVDYVVATRTATITLDLGSTDQNLQTFDDIHATFTSMRDVSGNVITATNIGTTAVTSMIGGDTTPPTLLASAPGASFTTVFNFSEAVAGVATGDLMSGSNPTGTEFILTDASDPGARASGTIELTGTVVDEDSVIIIDDVNDETLEFEFDYGAVGSITVNTNPAHGDTVTIDDGSATETFEFDDGTSGGITGTAVAIGADPATTASNLLAVIQGSALDITASAVSSSANIVALRNNSIGTTMGNRNLLETNGGTSALTLVGMGGGGTSSGDVAVPVDTASAANTIASLSTAINAASFDVTATPGTGATDIVVTQDNVGSVGNQPLGGNDANGVITLGDMTGGTNAGTATLEPTSSGIVIASRPFQTFAQFAVGPAAADTVRIYGVTDLAGNQMAPLIGAGLVAPSADPIAFSAGNSTGNAVSGENNDQFVLQFSADVHPDGLTNLANYGITGSSPLDLTGATIEQTGSDEVTITLGPDNAENIQVGISHTVEAVGIRNLRGVPMSGTQSDTVSPTGDTVLANVVRATIDPDSASHVFVEFDEAVSASVLAAANYSINGNVTSSIELANPRVVRVGFDSTPAVTEDIDITVAGQEDLAGNTATGAASVPITAADAAAPTVTSVTADVSTLRHAITVTFDEAWDPTSAAAPGNYSARIVGGAAISLTGATFRASSTLNEVVITLADGIYLTNGEDVGVTVANVTDVSGNAIVTAETTGAITGDNVAPNAATGFINRREDATETIVEVTFNERVDVVAATDIANWAGSDGQDATAVMMINGTTFRVTFDAAIAEADTISASNQADVAGNDAAGAIFIAPIE